MSLWIESLNAAVSKIHNATNTCTLREGQFLDRFHAGATQADSYIDGTHVHSGEHVHVSPDSPLFAWYIVIVILLVLSGGVFSGLTLGLMGLDTVSTQLLGREWA
jgi:hypothetical protein